MPRVFQPGVFQPGVFQQQETLVAPFFADQDAFYAPDVRFAPVTPRFVDSETFYSAEIGAGPHPHFLNQVYQFVSADLIYGTTVKYPQSLTATHFASSDTFFSPLLYLPPPRDLYAPLWIDADQFPATVVSYPQALDAAAYSDDDVFPPPNFMYVQHALRAAIFEDQDRIYYGRVRREPPGQGFGAQILYNAATGLERAMADVEAERQWSINAEAVIDVWDPYEIALENLPYLAWGMGTNFWIDGWSETTKRAWVARQWEFKSYRGTLKGPKMAVDFAGRDVSPFGYRVRGVTVPPQRVFSGASLTAAQREAWMDTLPQLRVWNYHERGSTNKKKAFLAPSSGLVHSAHFCMGGPGDDDSLAYAVPSTAINRLQPRARWIVGGVETDTRVAAIGTYWQLYLKSTERSGVFSGRPFGLPSYFRKSDAYNRIVTIQPTPSLPWRSVISPSLEPVNSSYTTVTVRGTRGMSVFSDLPMRAKAYYVPSTAERRIYQRYAVNDGTLGPLPGRPPIQIMGIGRYGFPKYTAWLDTSVASKRPRLAAGEGFPYKHYWISHDPVPLQRVLEAVRASIRLADKVLLEIGPKPRFVAGGSLVRADISEVIVGRP